MTTDFRAQVQAALGAAYTVERELGGGGMSRVFVASETSLGRRVVVKVLPPELAAELSVERFRREIQLAAQLQNPHIVPLLAAGEGGGLLYFTMPYVDGESLRARLQREGELPLGAAMQVLRDVAKALAYAHRQGVIHRDIKPENILLSEGDALVADFGVAKALSVSTSSGGGMTSAGLALGTPAYMAPEQAAGDVGVDSRADLYALGAVAYEVFTGSALFPGRSPQAMMAAHSIEMPEPIERRRPNLPAPIAALVMRLLAKRPADRPQSADDVVRELESAPSGGATGYTAAAVPPGPTSNTRRHWAVGIAVAVIVAAGVIGLYFAKLSSRAPVTAAGVDATSIAVLPFVNMSGDKENDYFSDGMTEELIDRLANLQGLHVAARTSSFAFKGKEQDIREIGRQLGVANIVEGSVRRARSRVRVTAQLLDARNGYHRWSHTYDADLKDVFAVQQQIGTAIAGELKLALAGRDSAALTRAPTQDTVAHTLYLQARYLWNKRTGESLQRAVELLQRALQRDSAYADAWGALAQCYALLPSYAAVLPNPVYRRAMDAADHALRRDSMLATAWTARAQTLAQLWRYDEAEVDFRRALALNPRDATTNQWFSIVLAARGHMLDGLAMARQAVELDPLSLVISTSYGSILYVTGRTAEAEAVLRATLERDPTFSYAWSTLGLVLFKEHRTDSALSALRRSIATQGEDAWDGYVAQYGYMLAIVGQRDSARAILSALLRRRQTAYVSSGAIGLLQLGLGERDAAFAAFDRGIAEHDGFVNDAQMFAYDPIFDSLRTDPRYPGLLRRANLLPPR